MSSGAERALVWPSAPGPGTEACVEGLKWLDSERRRTTVEGDAEAIQGIELPSTMRTALSSSGMNPTSALQPRRQRLAWRMSQPS